MPGVFRSKTRGSRMTSRAPAPPKASVALRRLREIANPAHAEHAQRYFKTGPGEYAAGDRFLGVRVPVLRKLAGKFREMSLAQTRQLLRSRFHECRLLALIVLVERHKKASDAVRRDIHRLYLDSTAYVNNWDLVDASAAQLVGAHLDGRSHRLLYRLARSSNLWERRIAIIASYHCIRQGEYEHTLQIAELLIDDDHDLIHKAVGWMLREVGNRDRDVAQRFLRRHYRQMPRTMLRYAIERYPPGLRREYLEGRIA